MAAHYAVTMTDSSIDVESEDRPRADRGILEYRPRARCMSSPRAWVLATLGSTILGRVPGLLQYATRKSKCARDRIWASARSFVVAKRESSRGAVTTDIPVPSPRHRGPTALDGIIQRDGEVKLRSPRQTTPPCFRLKAAVERGSYYSVCNRKKRRSFPLHTKRRKQWAPEDSFVLRFRQPL